MYKNTLVPSRVLIIEWQRKKLAKVHDMAYQDILDEFDAMWYVRGLIITTNT